MAKQEGGKKKSDRKISDIIIGIVIIAIVILFVGTLLKVFLGLIKNSSNKTTKDTVTTTEADKLINKNLDSQYPATPTALAKYYCSVTKELHSKEVTDEQVEGLYGQLRKLFDEELLANNEYKKHLKSLKKEIEEYKENKQYIVRYEVADKDDVTIYVDEDGKDCTKVQIRFSIKNGSKWLYSTEALILRKDEGGKWRILGYEEVAVEKSEEDE